MNIGMFIWSIHGQIATMNHVTHTLFPPLLDIIGGCKGSASTITGLSSCSSSSSCAFSRV